METLAYTHLSIVREEAINPECEQNSFQEFNWKPPNSTWMGLLSAFMILSILGSASSTLAAYVRTNNSPLNVRSGPGLGYRVVKTLPSGTPVNLSGRSADGWLQLANGNWVYSRWIVGEGGGGTGGGAPSTQSLRPGSRGEAVTNLQNRLDALGFYNGPITGYYGELTEAAVREFQASRGLLVDGVAGTGTLTALYNGSGGGTGGGAPGVDSARVATNNSPLNVRSGPGLGYRVVDTLPNNTTIALSGRSVNGWSQLANGNWVYSRWIRGEGDLAGGGTGGGAPGVDTARVATNNSPLNVRSGPGLGYRVVDTLPNGAFINLSDRTVNGWSQLTNGNWVYSRWIRT